MEKVRIKKGIKKDTSNTIEKIFLHCQIRTNEKKNHPVRILLPCSAAPEYRLPAGLLRARERRVIFKLTNSIIDVSTVGQKQRHLGP